MVLLYVFLLKLLTCLADQTIKTKMKCFEFIILISLRDLKIYNPLNLENGPGK